MNENDAKVLSKLADKSPGWTVAAILIQRLPLIIGACLGTTGATALIRAMF
ncbi:hypothetical protein [Novosphingobium sp.]|jgi:hypothetical protein|uniref:hypothetical protein n=1 Tax=Novosphingobium sp. TaxID=1874826 RepID=UPI002FE13158